VDAVGVLLVRNLRKALRTPLLIAFSLLQPIVWLVMFTQTFDRLAGDPQFRALGYTSYVAFVAPSMIALSVLFSALQSGLSMVTDMDTGMLDKLCIIPIRRSSILLARVLADAVRVMVQAAIVLAVALAMGARVQAGVGGVLAILGVATLFGIAWAALLNFVALHTGNAELTMVVGLLFTLPVLFLTSAFFPRPLLPSWLQSVARLNPAEYLIDSTRQLMNFGVDWAQLERTVLVLVGVGVATMSAAILAFRQATH